MPVSWKVIFLSRETVFLWETAAGRKEKKSNHLAKKTQNSLPFSKSNHIIATQKRSEEHESRTHPRHVRKLSTKYQKNTCRPWAHMMSFPEHKVWEPKGTQTFLALLWVCSQEANQSPFTNHNPGFINPAKVLQNILQTKVCCIGLVYLRLLLLLCLVYMSLVWKRLRHPTFEGEGKGK